MREPLKNVFKKTYFMLTFHFSLINSHIIYIIAYNGIQQANNIVYITHEVMIGGGLLMNHKWVQICTYDF